MNDDQAVGNLFGGAFGLATSSNGPVPRWGDNPEFDRFCDTTMDGEFNGDGETLQEMRKYLTVHNPVRLTSRALWATWRTDAPRGREIPSRQREKDEDAELIQALLLSARESRAGTSNGSVQSPIVVPDDEDAELQRAIQMSEEEARASKRQRRASTPEDERRMLAEAMAASLAEQSNSAGLQDASDDEDLNVANAVFQASRAAFREEERKCRNLEGGTASSARPEAVQPASAAQTASAAVPPVEVRSARSAPLSPAPRLQSGGALGDRAQMERDRLARQAQRGSGQTGQAGASTSSSTSVAPGSATSTSRGDGARVATLGDYRPTTLSPTRSAFPGRTLDSNQSNVSGQPRERSLHPLQGGTTGRDDAGEYFLDGEMRHTALRIGEWPVQPVFSLPQVIGRLDQIDFLILSSFVIDDEWQETILPPADVVPRIVVRPHPKEMHPAWNGKVQAINNGEVRCYPQMVGDWGSAHMKYFWIFFKTGRLRVVILTANFVTYDWDCIENTVFVQDFLPRAGSSEGAEVPLTEDFPLQFRHLFAHTKVHKALKFLIQRHPCGHKVPIRHDDNFAGLARWDWSRVRVKLVMSIPGTYTGIDEMDQYGLCRIGKVASDNGWKPRAGEVVRAEYQSSSLGNYAIDWFNTFYQYCCGKTTQALMGRPKPSSFPPLKVLFPTLATVDASLLSRDGGGTMFCGKAYNTVTKRLFHDANSKRGGILMHSKVLIALFGPRENLLGVASSSKDTEPKTAGKRKVDEMEGENDGVGGWVYVGSHNFSTAAWGTVSLKKSPPSLTIRNYELGIMFPLPRKDMEKVADVVAPHKRPPRPYGPNDVPWDQKLQPESST